MFIRLKVALATSFPVVSILFGTMGLSTPAQAQEASPWNGFYAGLNAGGAWSNSDADSVLTVNGPAPSNPIAGGDVSTINSGTVKGHLSSGHHNTFTGGGEAGYNYVMDGGLMLGIETDIDYFRINRERIVTVPSATNPAVAYTVGARGSTDFLWTLRPRIGYAMDKILIFASGGLALTEAHYDVSFVDSSSAANSFSRTKSSVRTGWTLGGGAAYAITPQISVKGEYLYQDFGTQRTTATSSNGYLTLVTDTNLKSHLFRAGVDYRF